MEMNHTFKVYFSQISLNSIYFFTSIFNKSIMNDKTAVITGGCGGIGIDVIKSFFAENISVSIINFNESI